MAVAFDATSSAKVEASPVSSTSWSHALGASAKMLVVAFSIHSNGADSTGVSVTWDSAGVNQAFTMDSVINGDEDSANNSTFLYVFYLINPGATGSTKTISVAWTNTARFTGGSVSFNGAGSVGTAVVAAPGLGTTWSSTVSGTTANDMILGVSAFTDFGTTVNWDSPATERWEGSDSNQMTCGCGTQAGDDTSISGTNGTNSHKVYGAIPIIASASGPASVKTINGLAIASVKTVNGLAIASVKTVKGLA